MNDFCGRSASPSGAERPQKSWRVVVDRDLCQGHGVCESEAPALFEVSKAGELTVLDDAPPDDERRSAEAAVKYCPTHALTIVED